jgi:hypothetical protein
LRPNVFARLARFSATRPGPIVVFTVFALTLLAGLVLFAARYDLQATSLTDIGQTAVANQQCLDAEFPEVENTTLVRISADVPARARSAAVFMAQKLLRQGGHVTRLAIPGIGPFYEKYGLLYLDSAVLEQRLARARQLQPLFQALGSAPNLAGLTVLLNQVSAALQEQKSPDGLDMLFSEIARTITSQANNQPSPVDWLKVAGLAIDDQSHDWALVILPKPGATPALLQEIEQLRAGILGQAPDLTITTKYPDPPQAPAEESSKRKRAVAAVLALLFSGLALFFFARSLRAAGLLALVVLAGVGAAYAVAIVLGSPLNQVTLAAPVIAALACVAVAGPMARALAEAGTPRDRSSLVGLMLAAQHQGIATVVVAIMLVALWAPWLFAAFHDLRLLAVQTIAAVSAATAATLFLLPAFAALAPAAPEEPAPPPAGPLPLAGLGAGWRIIRPFAATAVLLAALSGFALLSPLPPFRPATAAGDTVQVLAPDEATAAALAEALGQQKSVAAVLWGKSLLPPDVEVKQQMLGTLAGTFDASTVTAPPGPQDPADNARDMEAALKAISDAAGPNTPLATSSHEFRRALTAMMSTAPDLQSTAAMLERLVFANLPALAHQANTLAETPAPTVQDLDPPLRSFYLSDHGLWRLSVLRQSTASPASLVQDVQAAGGVPIGRVVASVTEQRLLAATVPLFLLAGLAAALLAAFAYHQRLTAWLIVVVLTVVPFGLFAVLETLKPMTLGLGEITVLMAVLTVTLPLAIGIVDRAQGRMPAYLATALAFALGGPVLVLRLPELRDAFAMLLPLLALAAVFNALLAHQLKAWLGVAKPRGRRRPAA